MRNIFIIAVAMVVTLLIFYVLSLLTPPLVDAITNYLSGD